MVDFFIPCNTHYGTVIYNRIIDLITVSSISLNASVLYVSLQQKKRLKLYTKLITVTSSYNVIYSILMCLIGMRTLPYRPYDVFFTNPPFLRYTNQSIQKICLMLCYTIVYIHTTLPAIQFFFRYRLLTRPHTEYRLFYKLFMCSIGVWLCYGSTYITDYQDTKGLEDMVFKKLPGCSKPDEPVFSVMDKSTFGCLMHDITLSGLLSANFAVVIYYAYKTFKKLREDDMSAAISSRKLNSDINLVLFLQASLPFFFLMLPIALYVSGVVSNNALPLISIIGTTGSNLMPALDAIIVLFVLPIFRRRIFKFLHVKAYKVGTATKSSATEIHTVGL